MKLLFALAMTVCLNSSALPLATSPASRNVGIASWYGYDLQGRLQANGRPFDATKLTCASWHHPLGTQLRVTNISNGRAVAVTVTDRGPARRLKRVVDLSRAAFQSIANLDDGLCTVQIERIE